MSERRRGNMDPLTAALARLPIETSGQGDLDWYVNELILKARKQATLERRGRRAVRINRLRTA